MPDLEPIIWIIVGAAALLVFGLIVALATKSGRQRQEQEQKIRRSQTARVVSIVVLLVLIVGFAVANAHSVSIDWVFTETNAPMFLVIGLSGGVGLLVGALITSRNRAE